MPLTFVIFLPLLGALVLALLPRSGVTVIRAGAIAFSALTFVFSLGLLAGFDTSRDDAFQLVDRAAWIPQFGIQYKVGVDGISLAMILLTTLLSLLAVVSSWSSVTERVKEYFVALLVLETGMLGVFAALDLIVFYIFWEASLIPMFLLIGVWGGPRRRYATIKFVLYTLVGSLLMLVAIAALYLHTRVPPDLAGTFDIPRIVDPQSYLMEGIDPGAKRWMFLAFALAFAIKVPLWPLHTWLPDAHVEAPTAGSVLLAGVLLKMGTYGFVRFCIPLFPEAAIWAAPWIIALAIIGIIYGAVVALAQEDVKKLVAYSSVSHLGFCMLGLFAFMRMGLEADPQLVNAGVLGAVLQSINHGLATGALFLIVGMLYERRHTREIAAYGGLWKVLPVLGILFLIVTLASIGLPGLSGFVGEFMILIGSWAAGPWVTISAASGIVLGAIYMLWMYRRIMQGPLDKEENARLRDLNWREIATLVPLVLLMFWIGLFPNKTIDLFDQSVARNVVGPVRRVHLQQQLQIGEQQPEDGETERRSEGETERRSEGEMERAGGQSTVARP